MTPDNSTIGVVADAQRVEGLRTAANLAQLAGRTLYTVPMIHGQDFSRQFFDMAKEMERLAKEIGGATPASDFGWASDDDGRQAVRDRALVADDARELAESELAEFKRLIGSAVAGIQS